MEFKNQYEIRNSILNHMLNELSKIEGSYNFDIATAVATEIEGNYITLEDLYIQMFPWTVTREPFLSYHMATYGLTRLGMTKATGEVTITGKVATLIPKGTVVISRLGQKYTTNTNAVIGQGGTVIVGITAVEEGEVGNCSIADITAFEVVQTNITKVYNEKAITGGAELETVENCIERMKIKASIPAHSGNKNEYRIWTKEVGGVGNVSVFGAGEHGIAPGQVHIYFATTEGTIPSNDLIQQVKTYIETDRRPVNADVHVLGFQPLTTNITFSNVTVKKGSITKEAWITEFKEKIQLGYATDGFVINSTVPFPKLSSIALENTGTVIYSDMQINGSTSNLSIAYNQTPVVGTVTITTFTEVD